MSDPSASQFKQVWDAAIKKYEDITHQKLEDVDLRSLQTVDDLEMRIEKERGLFDEFRRKKATLFEVMRKSLIPVQAISNMIAMSSSMPFPPSSLVFAAVSYLIDVAKDVSSTYDSIQALMAELQEFTARLEVYSREKISSALQLRLANSLATMIEIFALSRKALKHSIASRVLSFGKAVVLGRDEDVQNAVTRLDSLTRHENLLVSAETHTEVTRQGRAVDEVAALITATSLELRQGQDENREQLSKMYNLLTNPPASNTDSIPPSDNVKRIIRPSVFPEDTYKRLSKQHLAGTGEWVFDEKVFDTWAIERKSPVIFIQGIPGAGKSFLSTNIISYFKERYPQGVQDSAQVSVCYFYFKDSDPNTRSIHQALRDIAFQICLNDPIYARYIDSSCTSFDDVKTIESAWRVLFEDFFLGRNDTDSSVFIVLDGLDEAFAGDRDVFLPLLQDIAPDDSGSLRLHLALVGRPQLSDEIAVAFETDTTPTISIDAVKNSRDIESYIDNSIRKSRKLRAIPRDLQALIKNDLTKRADGMFLWVDLMLRELSTRNHPSAIREALQKAPRGLDAMIQRVLEGLSESLSRNPENAEDLNYLLAWVTLAQKPLTLDNLNGILQYKSETYFSLESSLREDYACFFLVTREDGLSTADLRNMQRDIINNDRQLDLGSDEPGFDDPSLAYDSNPETTEVTFCHASIGDYFRNQNHGKVRWEDGPAIGVELDSAKVDILKTLIGLCLDRDMEKTGSVHNLLDQYGAPLWANHMRIVDVSKVSRSDKEALGPMLVKFCRDPESVETWSIQRGYDFWTKDYATLLQKWLTDPELLGMLPQDDQDWVISNKERPISLFQEVARISARQWLQGDSWSALGSFYTLWVYLQLMAGDTPQPDDQPPANAHVIEEAAGWAGFAEDALWHRRVAMACYGTSFLDESEDHYRAAIRLSPTMWHLHSGLGWVYYLRGEYDKAIEYTDAEIKIVENSSVEDPNEKNVRLAANFMSKAHYYHKWNKPDECCIAEIEVCSLDPLKFESFAGCIKYLSWRDRHEEVMSVIKTTFQAYEAKENEPFLVKYLVHRSNNPMDLFFGAARRAAKETGDMAYYLRKLREAIQHCASSRRNLTAVALSIALAETYMTEQISSEEAIQIWERVVYMSSGSKNDMFTFMQEHSVKNLSNHYFIRAQETVGLEQDQYVSKLEDMATTRTRLGNSYNVSHSSLVLGSWYQLSGSPDRARACFRVHVNKAVQILSDDDPDNDIGGYIELANALLLAGDEENAVAIYKKLSACSTDIAGDEDKNQDDTNNNTDSLKADKSPVDEQDKEDSASLNKEQCRNVEEAKLDGWSCDGICTPAKPLLRKNPLWICRYCVNMGFCPECLALLQADKLDINRCHSKHSWVKIQPLFKAVPADQIPITDDKLMGLEEFKTYLKRSWGL